MGNIFNITYWIYLYLDVLFYANFVESYNVFIKRHMNSLRYQAMSMIIKPVILRDIAIPVSEFYKNFKEFAPKEYDKMLQSEDNISFIDFTKRIRNNMKYLPNKNKSDITRIDRILDETSRLVKADSFDGKQTFDYFSGFYFGKHRLYGSPLITNRHIFHETNKKYDSSEFDKYLNSIPENLKVIINALDYVFEKTALEGIKNLDFYLSIPSNKKRNIFTAIHLNRNIDDMVAASGFEKEIIYLLILAIQEINAVDFCLGCIFDEAKVKENTMLLFFFTKWMATKLDEIIDMFEAIIKYGDIYNLSANRFSQKLKSEIGSFDDIRNPVRTLRNASKMSFPAVENRFKIDINAIFNTVCPGYRSKDDYLDLYNTIKNKLKLIRIFCENNVGVKWFVRNPL